MCLSLALQVGEREISVGVLPLSHWFSVTHWQSDRMAILNRMSTVASLWGLSSISLYAPQRPLSHTLSFCESKFREDKEAH